jgi:hypothetical protein
MSTLFLKYESVSFNKGWKRWMADRQVSDFYWKLPWETPGRDSVLCHNFPYDIYTTKHSCGPNPKTCLGYDFRNVRGEYNGTCCHFDLRNHIFNGGGRG